MGSKRVFEVYKSSEPSHNKPNKRYHQVNRNGSPDNSSVGDSHYQSEARIEEEERKKEAKETRRGFDSSSRRSSSSRCKGGSSRERRLDGEVLNSQHFELEEEDLSEIMPKGYQMMLNMGYKAGSSLGKAAHSRLVPMQAFPQQNRAGLRVDESEAYRNWLSSNLLMEKKIHDWELLQRIAFELTKDSETYVPGQDPRDFNVLWRTYVKRLNGSIVSAPLISEPTSESAPLQEAESKGYGQDQLNGNSTQYADNVDGILIDGKDHASPLDIESLPDDYDGEDGELDLFLQLSVDEKIMKLHVFLRSELYYCFYCGNKYQSEKDLYQNCPGITANDHE